MNREELIRLAFQSGLSDDLWLTDETDYPRLERFAELVAAEYKQDAERYRFIRDNPWNGTDLEGVIVCHMNAVWDLAIDAAMEKVK